MTNVWIQDLVFEKSGDGKGIRDLLHHFEKSNSYSYYIVLQIFRCYYFQHRHFVARKPKPFLLPIAYPKI